MRQLEAVRACRHVWSSGQENGVLIVFSGPRRIISERTLSMIRYNNNVGCSWECGPQSTNLCVEKLPVLVDHRAKCQPFGLGGRSVAEIVWKPVSPEDMADRVEAIIRDRAIDEVVTRDSGHLHADL